MRPAQRDLNILDTEVSNRGLLQRFAEYQTLCQVEKCLAFHKLSNSVLHFRIMKLRDISYAHLCTFNSVCVHTHTHTIDSLTQLLVAYEQHFCIVEKIL